MGSMNTLESKPNTLYSGRYKCDTPPYLKRTNKKSYSTKPITIDIPYNISLYTNQPKLESETIKNIFIYDWDDTLLCTSYFKKNDIFTDNFFLTTNDKKQLNNLEKKVYDLLKLSIENGTTYIITNSADGWIQWSVEKFYPTLYPLLDKLIIKSARSLYEKKYPGNLKKWKIQTFLELEQELSVGFNNIICLGDSEQEIDACNLLATRLDCIYKTVKLRNDPMPEDLNKQLNIILDRFMYILNSKKSLTIVIEKE
jgi:hypothetical protein